jgi:hypothetical protein
MLDMARKAYPTSIDDLPAWLRDLPGYDVFIPMLRDRADDDPSVTAWQVNITLPADVAASADDVDPLVMLVSLAYARARVDDKIEQVVHACRDRQKSWAHIGQALGVSKQAAWERYSGED